MLTDLVSNVKSLGSVAGLQELVKWLQQLKGMAAQDPADVSITGGTAVSSIVTGTTTNDNAAAGVVGEYVTSSVPVGSAVSLTSNTNANITSISLTAGDWDVFGALDVTAGATTVITWVQGGASTTSATFGGQDTYETHTYQVSTTVDLNQRIPTQRLSLSSTTTVYMVAKSVFTTSTLAAYGTLSARRVR